MPQTTYAAPGPLTEESVSSMPGDVIIRSYTPDVSSSDPTACPGLSQEIGGQKEFIFAPAERDARIGVTNIYFHFHGEGHPETNFTAEQRCNGNPAFCNIISEHQDIAIVSFTRSLDMHGDEKHNRWFQDVTGDDIACMIREAQQQLESLDIPTDRTNYHITGHSAGGKPIQEWTEKVSTDVITFHQSIFLDASYPDWAKNTVDDNPNRGQTLIYFRTNNGPEQEGAIDAFETDSGSANTIIIGTEGLSHSEVGSECYMDHLTDLTQLGGRCGGAGTVITDASILDPSSSASITVGDITGARQRTGIRGMFDPDSIEIRAPKLGIQIPGLRFSDTSNAENFKYEGPDGSTYLTIPFLGEYIAAIYRYAIAISGIIAAAVIIVSGLQWMTSAGGDGVTQAKQRITSAILGIGLAAASYLILFTINPDLVRIRNLNIQFIEGSPLLANFTFSNGQLQGECVESYEKYNIDTNTIGTVSTLPGDHIMILTDLSLSELDSLYFSNSTIVELFDVDFSFSNDNLTISDRDIFNSGRTENPEVRRAINYIKSENPNIKIIIAFSAKSRHYVNRVIKNVDASREALFQAIADAYRVYPDIDGISLDFEHPSESTSPTIDSQEYVALLREIRTLYPNKILDIYGPTTADRYDYDWPDIIPIVDHVKIMTYTVYSPRRSDTTGPYNPLYGAAPLVERYSIMNYIQTFVEYTPSIDTSKIVVGISPLANRFREVVELQTPASPWNGTRESGNGGNPYSTSVQSWLEGKNVCLHESGVKYAGLVYEGVPTQFWFEDYDTYILKFNEIKKLMQQNVIGGFTEWTTNSAGDDYWKAMYDTFK